MTVAIYLRISKKEEKENQQDQESNSIKGQRSIILDALNQMPEYAKAQVVEFCDDGSSGRNFKRPGVTRLLKQVQEGSVQCVMVKDFSRFGRNYLESGKYIFRMFPDLGVRFIAVNDGYDSMRGMEENSLEVCFRTLLYDIYSRDLSHKVKSALYGKARRGEYVCALAPYGYVKDGTDKSKILPDKEAAAQVQRIFQMAASGQATRQIARTMNEEQVPTPLQYRRRQGCGRTVWNCAGEDNFWTQQTVRRILCDERYTGKAVYGRHRREHAGDTRQIQVKKADWVTVDGAYPVIVSKEAFDLVQEKLQIGKERGKNQKSGNLLLGKVRCGACGHAMIHAGRKKRYFICHTPRVAPAFSCPVLPIPEADLLEIVQYGIWIQIQAGVDKNRLMREGYLAAQQKSETLSIQRRSIQKARSRLQTGKKELYEQYVFGQLDKAAYEKEKKMLAKKQETLCAQDETLEQEQKELCVQDGWYNQYEAARQFASDCMQELLQEVVVCQDHMLKIIWNFRYCNDFETEP